MKILELLDSPEKWTKYTSARDKYDLPIGVVHPDATQWCISGALRRCYIYDVPTHSHTDIEFKLLQAIESLGWGRWGSVTDWNDRPSRTFEEVRQVLEAAGV